jgi:hypothetical protein
MSFVFVSGANALQEEEEEINRQMSTEVGEPILEVQELLDAEPTDWNRVLQILNDTLQNEDPTPYERSVILQLRGNTYYNLDNIRAAIRDWQGALDTGALVADERITLRTNMGQLYFILEEFQAGIAQFQAALNEGAQLNANLSKLLASAYVQAAQSEPDGSSAAQRLYREGLQYAEAFYRLETNKTENDYSLVQLYYIELNRPQDELRVVRASLQDYPGSRRSWQNLVSLFARLERDEDAFEANKMMYLNGLFEEEEELFRLVQYYSYFENPYRGASILEREINAGRVPANERYLEALANMWRQASEFDRAIPVLERLSQTVQDGETALKLAEAYYQENDLPRAEVALETALQRGGLDETGKAWELLGTIRYNQDKRQGALQAFRRATDFRATRRTSSDWIRFVNAQIAGAQRRQLQRIQVQIEECALTIEAERRQLVLIGSEDESGRVAFPDGSIPDRCLAYFEPLYGQQIRTAEMTDEEFAQSEADRAAREAEEAAQAAG